MNALPRQPHEVRLRDLGVTEEQPSRRFDRVVRLSARLFGVSVVSVRLIDDERMFVMATVTGEVGTVAGDESVASLVVESGRPLVVADARADVRLRDHPAVRGEFGMRFFAGVPLRAPTGQTIGALCIVDDCPRTLSDDEYAVLIDLAAWVEHELDVERDLAHGSEVQRRLLPAKPPELRGLEAAGRCVSTRELGGDFFDWQVIDGRLQVALADVMGKGISAALISADVRATLRAASLYNDLPTALDKTAGSLEQDLAETASFVTLFVARIDPTSGDVEYIDAGHGLGVIVSESRPPRRLASDSLPLGVLPGERWQPGSDRLAEDEFMLAVSDGILDVFPDGASALQRAGELRINDLRADEVVNRVTRFAADKHSLDDMTAVVVRRRPLGEPR